MLSSPELCLQDCCCAFIQVPINWGAAVFAPVYCRFKNNTLLCAVRELPSVPELSSLSLLYIWPHVSKGKNRKYIFLAANMSTLNPSPSTHEKMRSPVCLCLFLTKQVGTGVMRPQPGSSLCVPEALPGCCPGPARRALPAAVAPLPRWPRGVAVAAPGEAPRGCGTRAAGISQLSAALSLVPPARPPAAEPPALLEGVPAHGGGWNYVFFRAPSNPNRSVRLRTFQRFRNTTRCFTTAISLQVHPA